MYIYSRIEKFEVSPLSMSMATTYTCFVKHENRTHETNHNSHQNNQINTSKIISECTRNLQEYIQKFKSSKWQSIILKIVNISEERTTRGTWYLAGVRASTRFTRGLTQRISRTGVVNSAKNANLFGKCAFDVCASVAGRVSKVQGVGYGRLPGFFYLIVYSCRGRFCSACRWCFVMVIQCNWIIFMYWIRCLWIMNIH